jgi:NtrC-family two-component system response regulator AlgB
VKLLRFLQHKEFERVGDSKTSRVDVRVIAATNRPLAEAVKEGAFREDLYYRVNGVKIAIPPLRSRPEDVLLLLHHFSAKLAGGKKVEFSPEALRRLTAYRWPGNIRELEHAIERAVLLAADGVIGEAHLPPEIQGPADGTEGLLTLDELERRHIARVLQVAVDLEEAALVLGIDPATLWRKRKKYGL